MYYVLNSFPIVFSLICVLINILEDTNYIANKIMYYLPFYQTVMEWFIIPFYLLVVAIYFIKKECIKFIAGTIFMNLSSVTAILINYVCWGVKTGNLYTPDAETVVLFKGSIFISTFIMIIGMIVFKIILKIKKSI